MVLKTILLYTGDYSVQPLQAVGTQLFTRYVSRPDVLITEGTYRNSIHPSATKEVERLAGEIQNVTASEGKVFSILQSNEPCVILSSGGLLSGGTSTIYAGDILKD